MNFLFIVYSSCSFKEITTISKTLKIGSFKKILGKTLNFRLNLFLSNFVELENPNLVVNLFILYLV